MGKASSRGPGARGEAELKAARVTRAHEAALLAHYEHYFGKPSHLMVGEKKSWGVQIGIYLFPPTEERPYITAATVGMSALPLDEYPLCEACAAENNVHKHRSEILMYLNPNWDFGDLICRYPLLMMTYIARTPHIEKEKSFGSGVLFRTLIFAAFGT